MSKTVPLSDALRSEYQKLFDTCLMRPTRLAAVDRMVVTIESGRPRYEALAASTGVPWHMIAVLNAMECNAKFTRHLANGDPLTARTVQVPAGRPPAGDPPFTWEDSASDALAYEELTAWKDWSVPGTLYQLEKFNGFGYRRSHPEVLSPYLWSFSTHYTQGKYVADGKWSATAVSQQCGAAVLLRRLAEKDLIVPAHDLPAFVGKAVVRQPLTWRRADRNIDEHLRRFQAHLNTLPNTYVPVDGRLNAETLNTLQNLMPDLSGAATRARRAVSRTTRKGGR